MRQVKQAPQDHQVDLRAKQAPPDRPDPQAHQLEQLEKLEQLERLESQVPLDHRVLQVKQELLE